MHTPDVPSPNAKRRRTSLGRFVGGGDSARAFEAASEELLVRMVQHGTLAEARKALEELHIRLSPVIHSYTHSRGLAPEEADDLAGTVWLTIQEKLADFDWQGKPLRNWVLAVAKRQSKAARRQFAEKAANTAALDEHGVADPNAVSARELDFEVIAPPTTDELDAAIRKAMRCLAPEDIELVTLLYFKGYNATQAAQALGKKPAAIRKAHDRVRDKLVACVARNGITLPENWRLLRD